MNQENLAHCPLCQASELLDVLVATDYTTTQETFQVQKCASCQFVFTNPRPPVNAIGKYYQSDSYISHTDGGKGILDRVYLMARNFTLRWKEELISERHIKGELLDVGCGTGEFIYHMKTAGWNVTGVEPTETAREKASQKIQQKIYTDLQSINQTFDVITMWHVLEHVHELHETVEKIKSVLKENGTIIIAVPNHESPDAKEYQSHWAAYDVPRHLWHFSKTTMQNLMNTHGMKIKEVIPMKLDAYYVSLLSEKYRNPQQSSLMNMMKATLQGLTSNRKALKEINHSSLIYIIKK
ncbi:MAG: class I SAM-dependent methyltransferase [Cyclobacteriaceae bacterium]|nr:class I SAM-dependent methyltransferase [Cyclobacteriaceae bacterium]